MTETAEQTAEVIRPKVKVAWDRPQPPPTAGGIDWGIHAPDLPIESELPADGERPDAALASQLMAEIYGLFKADLVPWRWLTSPDLGVNTSSFSRPDLIAGLAFSRELLLAIREELLHGPRRTVWDPEARVWRVIVPSAIEEGTARREGKLKE